VSVDRRHPCAEMRSITVSPALSPTCGTRLPVMELAWRRAYDVAPGVAGLAYRTLTCVLGSHDSRTEHAAVARPLHPPQGTTVWAHWGDTAGPSLVVSMGCPDGADVDRQECGLFTGHPGLCTFAFGNTPAVDSTRMKRIEWALSVLDDHTCHEHETVWLAGHDAALLTWDELRARRIWERLAPWDQAFVYWVISHAGVPWTGRHRAGSMARFVRDARKLTGLCVGVGPAALPGGEEAAGLWESITRLPETWQAVVVGEQRAPHRRSTMPFAAAVREVATQAVAGKRVPEPGASDCSKWDDQSARERGALEASRLARLPHGWAIDAVRRTILEGGELSASDAAMAINRLRNYGIDLRVFVPEPTNSTP
jgi:hypothetical protein